MGLSGSGRWIINDGFNPEDYTDGIAALKGEKTRDAAIVPSISIAPSILADSWQIAGVFVADGPVPIGVSSWRYYTEDQGWAGSRDLVRPGGSAFRSHSNRNMLIHPAQRVAVLAPGGYTAFRSHPNRNMLIHPAQREAALEPGGYTAFRSHSNRNMLIHPARACRSSPRSTRARRKSRRSGWRCHRRRPCRKSGTTR